MLFQRIAVESNSRGRECSRCGQLMVRRTSCALALDANKSDDKVKVRSINWLQNSSNL